MNEDIRALESSHVAPGQRMRLRQDPGKSFNGAIISVIILAEGI